MQRLWKIGSGLAVIAFCCAARGAAVHRLNPQDAEKLLAEGDVYLLDVRTPKEFEIGHIPNAQLIPLRELDGRLKELPKDRTQPVLVYCSNGDRSAKAAHLLYREGRKDVYTLTGGLRAWVAAQKPLQVATPSPNTYHQGEDRAVH